LTEQKSYSATNVGYTTTFSCSFSSKPICTIAPSVSSTTFAYYISEITSTNITIHGYRASSSPNVTAKFYYIATGY